jgi:hypothetical protein
MCAYESHDPIVSWARSLSNGTGSYTGIAYIKNPQWSVGGAAYNVHYTFRLLDANNHLIIEQSGTTDLPAVETIPIIAPNIPTGTQTVTRSQFAFTTIPIVWTTLPSDSRPIIRVKNQSLAPDATRLSATIVNEVNLPLENLAVAAVLFDADGNAVAASRSLIKEIDPEGQTDVVFTWPQSQPTVVRAEIIPLPELPQNPKP